MQKDIIVGVSFGVCDIDDIVLFHTFQIYAAMGRDMEFFI